MKESKPLYVICDHSEALGIVWETELGKIVTIEGTINPNNNLSIKEIDSGEEISNVDLRNVIMSILPIK